jgi:hypothetical protein
MHNVNTLPRWAICGAGRAGKDHAALYIAARTPMRFVGSTSWYLLPYMADALSLSLEEAWARRHEQRDAWYRKGRELRARDPLTLLRSSLAENDLVVGCRDREEIQAARASGLLDLVIWIDPGGRVPMDPTLTYGAELADIVIQNWDDVGAFDRRLDRFLRNSVLAPLVSDGRHDGAPSVTTC